MTDDRRPVTELVALMLTGALCLVILGAGATLTVATLAAPDADLADEWSAYAHGVGVLAGAVLGFLVGRQRPQSERRQSDD